MKNYIDFSRTINAVIAIIFSVCFFLPLISYAEAQSKELLVPLAEKISINSATEKQLVSLKGIGVKKAKAIILYREKNGSFKSLEDLSNVKGIGTKILSDNSLVISI